MSNDNTTFRATLFNNTRGGERQPNMTGHISVPVEMIEDLREILLNQRTYNELAGGMTIKTVRIPLSFWTATGKAPLAYQGQASFYTPQPQSEANVAQPAASAPYVDATPTLEDVQF